MPRDGLPVTVLKQPKRVENACKKSPVKSHYHPQIRFSFEMASSSVVIKKEKVDDPRPGQSAKHDEQTEAEIEARMLELLREFPKGINYKILETDMPNVDKIIKVNTLNRLLSQVNVLMELPIFH